MSLSPVRLNHAVLFVADLDRSLRFYADTFGMQIVAREPRADAVFLRLPRSGNHHDLGLFGVGHSSGTKRRGTIGLYHLAWQLDTIDELVEARRTLLETGAYSGESSHGATKSIYGADPDGNEFEIMWMLPRSEWGPYEHSAPIDHLDLAAEVRRWSGVRTAEQITASLEETPANTFPAPVPAHHDRDAAPLAVLRHGRGSNQADTVALTDIERGVMQHDPAFVRRFQRLERADDANAATIFALLVASVVLLAVGLATVSWVVWIAGASAFIGAFAVDYRYRRKVSHPQDNAQ